MTIRKSTSTVMTIRKAQNNTVNTYINTKKHFTHSHLLYDYAQTPAHSHPPPHNKQQQQEKRKDCDLVGLKGDTGARHKLA